MPPGRCGNPLQPAHARLHGMAGTSADPPRCPSSCPQALILCMCGCCQAPVLPITHELWGSSEITPTATQLNSV